MRRRQIKGNVPVRCSFCGEKKAFHAVHGYPPYGKTACDLCYVELKKEQDEESRRDAAGDITEAAYQIQRSLFVR